MEQLSAERIINDLAMRIAQLEVDNAILRAQIPTPEPSDAEWEAVVAETEEEEDGDSSS